MPRKRPEHPPVHRTDLLRSPMTAAKEYDVRAMLTAYRKGAVLLGREQWRLFFGRGAFDKTHDTDKVRIASVVGAANRVQMCRFQVVGVLESFISNRQNEFRSIVNRSSLPARVKHQIHTINMCRAWFARSACMTRRTKGETCIVTSEAIPDHVRALARSIMRSVLSRHRRPNLSRISMRLDLRAAVLRRPTKAKQKGKIGWWVRLATMDKGRRIEIPLETYEHHDKRVASGKVAAGIQINCDRDGTLTFGIVTDLGETCVESRKAFTGRGAIALDFGLSTLFATPDGNLLGQGFLRQLRRYDTLITGIARHRQRLGLKPRDSKRYRATVARLRGYLKTEIGRVMNRLVATGRPAELVLERLDFRHSELSARMNRILRNHGRAVIVAKLRDLEERYGIKHTDVNAAYTSQTCSCCGYVDKKNRRSQAHFACLWCGSEMHADVNAAVNIEARRARPNCWLTRSKAAVLSELVRAFGERRVRASRSHRSGNGGIPADPRTSNPYFQKGSTGSSSEARSPGGDSLAKSEARSTSCMLVH